MYNSYILVDSLGPGSANVKIVSLTTSYPHEQNTASGIFVGQLLGAISQRAEVMVVTPSFRGSGNFLQLGNEAITSCRYAFARHETLAHAPGGVPVAVRKRPILARVFLFTMMLSMFASLLRKVVAGVDIIHANWSFSGFLALPFVLLGKKLVVTLRGDDVTRAMTSKLNYVLMGVLIKLSSHVIVVSKDMQSWLQNNYNCANKLSYIGNGVAELFFKVGQARCYPEKKSVIRFVSVGNLIPRKNNKFILHGLASLPESIMWSLVIVGDGPEQDMLGMLSHELKISEKVKFCGALDHSAIAQVFADSDALLFSSLSEGKPNVVMEAMAAGLLVVAPRIPGVNELLLEGRFGLLYGSENREDFAQALKHVCSDFSSYKNRAIEGMAMASAEVGGWHDSATKYLNVFAQVCT
jgi:glycosyltransferase involved in cell wall biosynthesis